MGEPRRAFVEHVAGRLQSELHMPAVKEALGCLIPLDLHDSYDSAKGRQKKMLGQDDGVYLKAGKWRINVCLEQALAAGRAIKASELEFFLLALCPLSSNIAVCHWHESRRRALWW